MVPTVLLIVGNVIALLGGLWFFADRFRRWIDAKLDSKVAEPVARIEVKLSHHELAIKRNERETSRAHSRIDRLWSPKNA